MAVSLSFEQFKAGFFDTEKVKKLVGAAQRKAQARMGAFVRVKARSSIRTRKKSSPPGRPPSSHEGSLKRLIFFAYDAGTNSTVVGPVGFKRGDAPRLLEHGGRTTIRRKTHSRPATYRGHPFIAPAGRAEAPKFKDLLKGMVN